VVRGWAHVNASATRNRHFFDEITAANEFIFCTLDSALALCSRIAFLGSRSASVQCVRSLCSQKWHSSHSALEDRVNSRRTQPRRIWPTFTRRARGQGRRGHGCRGLRRISAWEIHPAYAIDVCVSTSLSGCPGIKRTGGSPQDKWWRRSPRTNEYRSSLRPREWFWKRQTERVTILPHSVEGGFVDHYGSAARDTLCAAFSFTAFLNGRR
jgi:hypothetical protein